jgi:VacB/RNase II family 3'-5' exoribonuclease
MTTFSFIKVGNCMPITSAKLYSNAAVNSRLNRDVSSESKKWVSGDGASITTSVKGITNTSDSPISDNLKDNSFPGKNLTELALKIKQMPIEKCVSEAIRYYDDRKITPCETITMLKEIAQSKENIESGKPFYILHVKNINGINEVSCIAPDNASPSIRPADFSAHRDLRSAFMNGDFILAKEAQSINETLMRKVKEHNPQAIKTLNGIIDNLVLNYINGDKAKYFKDVKSDAESTGINVREKYLNKRINKSKNIRGDYNEEFNKLYYASKGVDINNFSAVKMAEVNRNIFENENNNEQIKELILNDKTLKYISTQSATSMKENRGKSSGIKKNIPVTPHEHKAEIVKVINPHLNNGFFALINHVSNKNEGEKYVVSTLGLNNNKSVTFNLAPNSNAMVGSLVNARLINHPITGDGYAEIISDMGVTSDSKIYAQTTQRLIHKIPLAAPNFPEDESNLYDINKAKRVDMTDKPFFTIDSADTQSMDDAIYIEKLPNDRYRLHVAIADVSSYVLPGSKIDNEARQRGFTSYMPNSVVPMLPDSITYDLCSLKAGEEKAALVCSMTISGTGELVEDSVAFQHATIKSIAKCDYPAVSDLLDHPQSYAGQNNVLYDQLKLAHDCTMQIRDSHNGSNPFFVQNEYKIKTHPETSEFVDVETVKRGSAEYLIEEAMIIANKATAAFLLKNTGTALLRAHDGFDNYENVTKILKGVGIELAQPLNTYEGYREVFKHISSGQLPVNTVSEIIGQHSKAYYGWNPKTHMSLGNEYYATFTSPIRKHGDIVNHRLISEVINRKHSNNTSQNDIIQTGDADYSEQLTALSRTMKYSEAKARKMIIYNELSKTVSPENPFPIYGDLRFSNKFKAQVHLGELNTIMNIGPAGKAREFSAQEKKVLTICSTKGIPVPMLITNIDNRYTPPNLIMRLDTDALKDEKI